MARPVYERTCGRVAGDETVAYRDHGEMRAKHLRRPTADLATRAHVDAARLAWSWGGYLGRCMPTVDPRVTAGVLNVAALHPRSARDPRPTRSTSAHASRC